MLKKEHLLLVVTLIISFSLSAQRLKTSKALSKPKLVVGIVVDQMRYDFLYRYSDKYSANGFQRLLNYGFSCRNNHYNYAPTVTAAGHAAIFTGSTPAINGIVGNDWFIKKSATLEYCVNDTSVRTVGSTTKAGWMSPKNLLVSTITDQLRIANNFQSKTIGIALKDRGAILPAGHTANQAFWFDSQNGSWISSTFYMSGLPQWVKDFNALKLPQKYMASGWNTFFPIENYTESTTDNQVFESKLSGEKTPTFPHELAAQSGINLLDIVKTTPFGNSLTKDFALATIKNEQLGQGKYTDFLTISFSSTDYVGHSFGPNSIETEDTYLRLDRDIAEILTTLDNSLGKDNYLVFLTADHGIADIPALWKTQKLPADVIDFGDIMGVVSTNLKRSFGEGEIIKFESNYQFYLDDKILKEKKITHAEVYTVIREALMQRNDIADVVDLQNIRTSTLPDYQKSFVSNGYNPRRSGDIMYVPNPSYFPGRNQGTTHGSFYRYDTHVPLIFFGWNIRSGETTAKTSITDIAPTLADLLDILEPNGSIGEVISGLKK